MGKVENATESTDFSEAEIEAFNSRFTVYQGEKVSTTSVNQLLNEVFISNQEEAMEKEHFVEVTGDIEFSGVGTIERGIE